MDRSLLEYASTVWNLHYENLINSIETVQMRATKVVITVKHLPYSERIQALQLTTWKYHRFRGDIIEVYKSLKANMMLTSTHL